MKVFFLPYYFYLHYSTFHRLIAALRNAGVDASLLHMPCSALDEGERFAPERLREQGCPVRELPLPRAGWDGSSTTARVSRFPSLLLSRRRIRRFLHSERPDMVVVGSDLGGIHVRLFLDSCRDTGIPVLVLATVIPGPSATDGTVSHQLRVPAAAKAALRLLGLEEAALFTHWLIGTYAQDAPIAVPGAALKERLTRHGIAPERIFVTGDPAHDPMYELTLRPAQEIRRDLMLQLGWPAPSRLIVYCTEVVHEVYGVEYVQRLNAQLARALAQLPPDVRVIVKLHPREPGAIIEQLRTVFAGERFRVLEQAELLPLLRAADLCLGHFSKTLVDAILLGTCTVCINLQQDENRALLDPTHGLLRIEREDELLPKLAALLQDTQVRERARSQLAAWRDRFAMVDGRSAERTADLIRRLAAH